MKNKKQIPFNFELWGTEGISVDDIMGRLVIKLHENPIRDDFYGIVHDGSPFACKDINLIMYQEVKPREIWVNEYTIGLSNTHYPTKELATKYAANTSTEIRQVKFIEIID